MDFSVIDIIKEIKDSGLTAYKIAEGLNGELTEVGINKILNGTSKNPHQKTLKKIHNYLASYKAVAIPNSYAVENKTVNRGMFTDDYIRELCSNELFMQFIDERVNEANKKLQMADYNEEKAKIRREIEKQRQEQQKTKKA